MKADFFLEAVLNRSDRSSSLWQSCAAVLVMVATCTSAACVAQTAGSTPTDKNAWLEDIYGDRQLAWVREHNEKTAAVLEKQPIFGELQSQALSVLESPDRLPTPELLGGAIYNTWQDAQHVRGILRRTTEKDYLSPSPTWETVLDYDALAKADKQSWVHKGMDCLAPASEVCMVALSVGGEDAVTLREFNLKAAKFVEGGFVLPRGKQNEAWLDKDTLLISRDWGPGTMSEAGYPITVRIWKRGDPLEKSVEVFKGDVKDNGYGNSPIVFRDAQGRRAALIVRSLSTFEQEWNLLTGEKTAKLGLPLKCDVQGFLDNKLLIALREDWTPEGAGTSIKQGSLVAIDLDAARTDPAHLKPTVVFEPTADEFMQETGTTLNHLILSTLAHVQGRVYVYTPGANNTWTRKKLSVPDNQSVSIASTSALDERFFLSETGFLNPNSVWLGDAGDGSLKMARTERPLFDASQDVVDQLEATSKDGTKVPYFVVHRKDMAYNGTNPTLMTAYGGFQISMTPYYDSSMGKLWLERGGVFVLANIRGGGEFGPAWHDAGLKTHRQRIYDDFYAVAKDLMTRKITSPQKLGIEGGSNGGLLMGVEFTQHPEMWAAVVIQVPLLDMLGFEHMSAGASWVGEYGSVSVPAERAFLASISPYNQLKPNVKYPEPLIFTTTKDDRVGPVHARKFAARMEELHLPFFYDEIVEGGHAYGADNKQAARTRAEEYTYLIDKLMK